MQCPLSGCCVVTPKFMFSVIGLLGFSFGVLSAFDPERSIGLYQRIMKGFNWNVSPIDPLREVRNTRLMGLILTALSVGTVAIVLVKF